MNRVSRAEPVSTPAVRRFTAPEIAYVFLRSATGLLFLMHGLQKLFGLFGGLGGAAVPLASKMGVAGALEFVGGLLLVSGLFTRPVALVLAGEMVIAYVTAHLPRGMIPLQNGGEVALLYAVIFVFLALTPHARD